MTLSDLLNLLRRAREPEEIFGALAGDLQVALKRRYRELITLAHPDHNQGETVEANEACKLLHEWYATAQQRIAHGSYGAPLRISVITRQHRYTGYEPPLYGDLCDLFPADADGMRVLLKVARQVRNNDLLQTEADVLWRIDRALDGQAVRAHFPTLVEHLLLRDEAGIQRFTNVLRAETGYVSLAQVLQAYPGGLDPADAAWMFNRLLAALGVVHSLGIVHGAVVPSHILIRPADHNGMLIDWCYSVQAGDVLKAISPPYTADYPPEVSARQAVAPATDIYMAARCMVRLLAGSGAAEDLPPGVPKPMRALLRACLIPSPRRRPADAWQLFDDFQEILQRLYGQRTFRPFRMPATA